MKCWKCGGHMSRSGGWATCDSCGRTVQYGQSKNSDYGGGGSIATAGAIIGAAWLASREGDGGTSSPPVVVRFVASLVGMALAVVACYLGYIAIMDMLFENLSGFVFLAFSTCLLLWTTMLTFMAGYGSAANSFRGFCLLMVGIILDTILKAGGAAIWCFDLKGYISSFLLKVLLGAALIISGHFARVPLKDVRLETMWRVENLRFIGGFLLPHHQVKVFLHATSFSKMLVIIIVHPAFAPGFRV